MEKKIDTLRALMDSGEWRKAVSLAARFPRLGAERGAILDAQMAYTNPAFCAGMRKDPDAMIAAGVAALRAKY